MLQIKPIFLVKNLLFLGSFLLPFTILQAQADAPTIQACGGIQEFCVDEALFDACVSIIVDPDYTEPIDYFEITWGDGTSTTVEGSLNPPDQIHPYDFNDFVGSCTYSVTDITIRLDTYLEDGTSINSGFFPTFVNYPTAEFDHTPAYACVGEEVCFGDDSCPTQNLNVLGWHFSDGTPLSENGCYTFDTPGTYTVTLEVENPCGTDEVTHTITILEPSVAAIAVVDGVANPDASTDFTVCLPDSALAVVSLDGTILSQNATSFEWQVISGSTGGYSWISDPPQNEPSQQIQFTAEGVYEIRLTTNNNCDQASQDVITITVEGGGLSLNPQEDACISLDYEPTPSLTDDVIYTINGEVVSDFPLTLTVGEYIVKVNGNSSFCAAMPVCDTFSVIEQATAMIATPDTQLCVLDAPLAYVASSEGGTWRINGSVFNGSIDPNNYGAGEYTITYGNEPCLITDTVLLTIVGAALTLPPDTELCIDDAPEQFMATPSGGTFSGQGITPEGIFDPAVMPVGDYVIYYSLVNEQLPACSNQDSFVVTVTELMADFSVVSCEGNTLCFELENTSEGVSASWNFGNTGTSNQLNPCHTFPEPGTYEVSLSVSRGACSTTVMQTITIEDAPIAGFNLNYDPSLCSDLLLSITDQASGNNLQYEWYLNGDLISEDAQPQDLVLTALEEPTIFTITQVVSNDCASVSSEQTLLVQPQATSIFGTDLLEYCSGDTVLIANTSTGLPDSYQWLFNGELLGTDSIPPSISYQTTQTDTLPLCLISTNACGADTLCTDLVFVPTDVNAFFNLDPAIVCVNDSVLITNYATTGADVFYDLGDGNTSSQASFAYQYETAGEYLIEQQAFGCGFGVFTQSVSVIDAPVASWINPALGCPGETLNFTNTSPDVMQYFWDFGDGTTSELEHPQHQFASPGTYEVCLRVTVQGVSSCSASLCQDVLIHTPVAANFSFSDSLCLGQQVEITNLVSQTTTSCFYDFGDGNFSDECAPSHTYAAAGDYLITQIIAGENGCLDTFVQDIHIRPLPEPAFTSELMNGCTPDTLQFFNNSSLASSYLWDFGDGQSSSLTAPTHVYTEAGMYTVTLTAFIDGICAAATSQVVTIAESPLAMIASDASPICAQTAATFTSQSTGPMIDHQWNMGDGITAYTQSLTHVYSDPGNYTVELIVSTTACTDTARIELVVVPAIRAATNITDVSCADGTDGAIDLTYLSGTAPFSTNWSNGSVDTMLNTLVAGSYSVSTVDANACTWDTTLVIQEPDPLSAIVSSTIVTCAGGADGSLLVEGVEGGLAPYQFIWTDGSLDSLRTGLTAGLYTLQLTDAAACERDYTVELMENPAIVFSDSTLAISCFQAHDGAITIDDIAGGTAPYEIFLTGATMENGVEISRFDSLGAGSYFLEVVDVNGCSTIVEHILLEPSVAAIEVQDSVLMISLGEQVSTNTFYTASEPVFEWWPTDGLTCSDCAEPLFSPQIDTKYIVELTDNRGCTAFDTLLVLVDATRSLWLPKAFTPNWDNRNDFFTVRTHNELAIERIEHFRIFDRWGGLVFEQKNLPANDDRYGWDGSKDGEPLAPGTYVYELEVYYVGGQAAEIIQGDVLLIR